MNTKIKIIFEVVILIVISFSPLLSQPLKAVLALLLVLLNIKYIKTLNKRKAITLLIFLSLFMIGLVTDFRNINSINQINILNFFFPLCILLGFLISQKYSIDEYFYYIEKVVFVIAIFSLVGVFIYTFLPSLVNSLPTYNYYQTSHKTAIIFNVLTSDSGVVARNAGIAWEPGAFQFLLNLGLYAYIKNNNKINLLKVIIYSLAIVFTKSTAGLIIFLFITFSIAKNSKIARLVILASIILFGGLIREEIVYQLNYKLFGSYAFEIRLEPFLNAFSTGKNYFLGMGNSGFDLYYRSINIPPWDSLGQIFIRYGYPLFIFIIFRLLMLIKNHKILLIVLLVTLSSQNIWFFPLIAPFYFIDGNIVAVKKKRGIFYENSMAN
jgi:hypothetical protein